MPQGYLGTSKITDKNVYLLPIIIINVLLGYLNPVSLRKNIEVYT